MNTVSTETVLLKRWRATKSSTGPAGNVLLQRSVPLNLSGFERPARPTTQSMLCIRRKRKGLGVAFPKARQPLSSWDPQGVHKIAVQRDQTTESTVTQTREPVFVQTDAAPRSSKPDENIPLASLFLALMVLDWVLGAKVHQHFLFVQRDLSPEVLGSDFQWVVRYLNMMCYALFLPVVKGFDRDEENDVQSINGSATLADSDLRSNVTVANAFAFALVYWLMGVVWMSSLENTTLGTNTSLYNLHVAFSLILSLVLLNEKASTTKFAGVACTILGSAALLTGQANGDSDSVLGIAQVGASAFLYSLYNVMFQQKIAPECTTLPKIMGWTGLMGYSMCIGLPFMLAVGLASGQVHEETFDFLWREPEMHTYLLTGGLTTIVYMPFLLGALRFSTPLFVSAGSVLTIPTSYLVDYITTGRAISTSEITGSALIALGFLIILDSKGSKKADVD